MNTSEKNTQQPTEYTYKKNSSTTGNSWAKRNGKSILIFAIIILAATWILMIVNHQSNKNEYAKLETQYQDLSVQLGVRDSMVNDWVNLFDQVEKDLQTIKEKENLLSSIKSEDVELAENKRESILRDIQLLNTLLADNKKKIAALNTQLKNSGMKIAVLEKKVEELSLALDQRNQHIDSLKTYLAEKDFEMAQLNTKLSDMEVTMAQKQSVINTMEYELNKGFIASGSYKELKEKGLINKEGGFLGVGRTKSLRDNVTPEGFTEVDITKTISIPVNSKKVRLITEHPSNSYSLKKDDNNLIATIEITNPVEFWRISKYAVVETIR